MNPEPPPSSRAEQDFNKARLFIINLIFSVATVLVIIQNSSSLNKYVLISLFSLALLVLVAISLFLYAFEKPRLRKVFKVIAKTAQLAVLALLYVSLKNRDEVVEIGFLYVLAICEEIQVTANLFRMLFCVVTLSEGFSNYQVYVVVVISNLDSLICTLKFLSDYHRKVKLLESEKLKGPQTRTIFIRQPDKESKSPPTDPVPPKQENEFQRIPLIQPIPLKEDDVLLSSRQVEEVCKPEPEAEVHKATLKTENASKSNLDSIRSSNIFHIRFANENLRASPRMSRRGSPKVASQVSLAANELD